MDIKHEFSINTTAEKLFEAFTTEAGLNGWWTKDCDIDTQVGGVSKTRFNDKGVEMEFRTDELKSGEHMLWTCTNNPNPSWPGTKLYFGIASSDNGVTFRFNHYGWDAQWKGQLPYEQTKGGWEHFMKSLKDYLETGTGEPW